MICLFKHQIDKSSKISPYPQCILQLRTLLKSPDSQHPHCQTNKDRTTRCVLVLFHTTQGLRALERLQRNKPPSPHFKKNRKISYSLSRISTVIMGFRSQYGALLQENKRGCLMATFSREGWVITEALPPSTNVQSKDCQRGQSVSVTRVTVRSSLDSFKAWILSLSTFFKLTFSTLNVSLLRLAWWITQNKEWLETRHNLTTGWILRKWITSCRINEIRPDRPRLSVKYGKDWRSLPRSHTHYRTLRRKCITT